MCSAVGNDIEELLLSKDLKLKGNNELEKVITFWYNGVMENAKKLNEILKESRWSQEELARRIGVSHKTLSFWLNGKAEPRANHIELIEKLYFEVVGRETVSVELREETEAAALATKIEIDELLTNEELLKTTTLYLTYHTNTIEGSTMTIEDVEKVLEDENAVIPDKTVREQMEARNHRVAFNYLLSELKTQGRDFRWTEELIRNTHLRLMNGVIESAGSFRLHGVRIMGSRTPLVNYLSVPEKIDGLVKFMNTDYDNLIERLAITHAEFEQIHPFADGNGRIGRLMMFIQALQAGIVPPLVLKERKRAYLGTIF